MDSQTTAFLKTKRLMLRSLEETDAERCAAWVNDPRIRTFIAAYLPQSVEEERAWIRGLHEKKDTDIVFAMVIADTNDHIGIMGLHRIDYRAGLAWTGSLIGRADLWQQGYGSEAKMAVLDYAFHTLMLRKVCTSVYAFNERSLGCQLKCGYREEGRLRQQRPHEGEYVDEIMLGVFRAGFEPLWQCFAANGMSWK